MSPSGTTRSRPGKETVRAQAYSLLRTVLGSAASERPKLLIPYNPAHIRGAGTVKRAHQVRPATLDELATIVEELPDRYQLMALLAAWCAMRFGELAELRCGDIDLRTNRVSITRGVVRVGGRLVVGSPKSDAGVRDVAIPPHLLPVVKAHLKNHTGKGKDALLFPAAADSNAHMAPSTLYKVYYPARKAAGREDLRWQDLRHTGAVLAAQAGATLAELMGRLGTLHPRRCHALPARRRRPRRRDREAAVGVGVGRRCEGGAVSDGTTWTTEFYEDDAGRRPVELWMDSLTVAEFAALRAGIVRVLEVRGIELGSTPWLKALGEGLFEFRVRHDAATIEALYGAMSHAEQPTQGKILLRLFVHFHGDKVILLLHGYDKGGDDSSRTQNKEIQQARKRLAHWKAAEAKRAKEQRKRQ